MVHMLFDRIAQTEMADIWTLIKIHIVNTASLSLTLQYHLYYYHTTTIKDIAAYERLGSDGMWHYCFSDWTNIAVMDSYHQVYFELRWGTWTVMPFLTLRNETSTVTAAQYSLGVKAPGTKIMFASQNNITLKIDFFEELQYDQTY